jgi:hypothetical protein
MNSNAKALLAGLAAAIAVLSAGVAQAASSPTLVTDRASSVTSSSAVLHGTVDPNGATTHYRFEWGLTTGYGSASPLRSAGDGSAATLVQAKVGSLLPGSVYHYRVVASNASGASSGADRTFKTKGHAPPGATTGPVAQVGLRSATLTGVVDPNGVATTYKFQYGLSSAYGSETFGASVPTGHGPVTVSQPIEGLSPGTAFHYRIVALHGGVVSYGSDATFVTLPLRKRLVHLQTRTLPRRDRRRPYLFTTTGRLAGAQSLLESVRCTGDVSVAFVRHRRLVASRLVPVQPSCTFGTQVVLRRLRTARHRIGLLVLARFHGNPYVAPVRARPKRVFVGRGR